MKEGDGSGSVPGNFSGSANLIKTVRDGVSQIQQELFATDQDRQNNESWTGPAADIYGSIVKSLSDYLFNFGNTLMPDGGGGWFDALNDAGNYHNRAVRDWETQYSAAFQNWDGFPFIEQTRLIERLIDILIKGVRTHKT